MQEISLDYGDGLMTVQLPDSATVVRYGTTYEDPPEVDPWDATQKALANPLGMPPLKELAKPGDKVVIAFPDRVKGGAHSKDPVVSQVRGHSDQGRRVRRVSDYEPGVRGIGDV